MMFLFLLFLFPTLVSAFIELKTAPFLLERSISYFDYFKYFFSFFVTSLLPYWYFFKLTNRKSILISVSFVRYSVVFAVLFCFLLIGHLPKKEVLLSCFDTNAKEFLEFMQTIPANVVLISTGYWVIYILLVLKTKIQLPEKAKGDFIFSAVCFIFFSIFGITTQFENNIFYWTADAYKTYRRIKSVADRVEKISAETINITDTAPSLKRTVVIIIGESETAAVFKEHSSQFSDLLECEKENVITVPKAETTSTQTLAVLENLFFHFAKAAPEKVFNLLTAYKTAGFKTFWLSNQYKSSGFDDFFNVMTRPVSVRKYYNYFEINSLFEYGTDRYDDVLLDGLKKALNDPAEKKLIFLHLFGSHNEAKNRYPDGFRSPLVEQKEKKNYSATEHYKNAAAYTNTVLAKALLMLSHQKEPTAAVYFSDHGDDPVIPFRRDYNRIKEVPLFFWLSKEYQKHFPESFKNLSCVKYVYFTNLPYLFNRVIGADIEDIPASPEIKACFEKEK